MVEEPGEGDRWSLDGHRWVRPSGRVEKQLMLSISKGADVVFSQLQWAVKKLMFDSAHLCGQRSSGGCELWARVCCSDCRVVSNSD